jgi:MFS family permease
VILDRIKDENVLRIYKATLLIGIAYGISLSLTPLHLNDEHFTKTQIGTLAAWFAGGIVLLSLPMGALIRRFSARAALILSLVGYAACVTVFPHLKTYGTIAIARFFDGAFSVGLWVCCETILLSRADHANKAFITSIYAMAMAIGYVVGPIIAKTLVAYFPMSMAFAGSGVLSVCAAAYLLLRLDGDVPETHAHSHGGDGKHDAPLSAHARTSILWRIKTSCFATFAYGYFQASVVLFLPLYLMEVKNIPRDRTILTTAFFAAGMLLFSNWAGRVGDRVGHLRVMRVLGIIGTTMILSFMWLDSFVLMCAAVFVAGATLASISPVSLALQGVVTRPHEYSRSNAIYNVFYALGMLLGPPVSSVVAVRFTSSIMISHLAGLWLVFIFFSIVFANDDPAARRGKTEPAVTATVGAVETET